METITVVVETPKGSNHKLNYEPKDKLFKIAKVLPAGMVFPFDFGFVPGTKGGDGDPLDVMVISELIAYPGVAMDCRIIGALKAEQTERDGTVERNDRFLAVPKCSQLFAEVTDIVHLADVVVKQIEEFFKNYNREAGKEFKVLERLGAEQAWELFDK